MHCNSPSFSEWRQSWRCLISNEWKKGILAYRFWRKIFPSPFASFPFNKTTYFLHGKIFTSSPEILPSQGLLLPPPTRFLPVVPHIQAGQHAQISQGWHGLPRAPLQSQLCFYFFPVTQCNISVALVSNLNQVSIYATLTGSVGQRNLTLKRN